MSNSGLPAKKQPTWAPRFLAALRLTGNASAAATAAGVSRKTVYNRRLTDADFARDWAEASDEGCDALEGVAYDRAVNGTRTLRTYKGEPIFVWVDATGGVVTPDTPGAKREPFYEIEYSDGLLLAMLKALRPAKWNPSSVQPPPAPLPPDPDAMGQDEKNAKIDELARRLCEVA